mgnify:CR=1 FL=1
MKRVLAFLLAFFLLIPCMPLTVQADTLSQAASAITLNGTEKKFQVGFDAGANAVGITTGAALDFYVIYNTTLQGIEINTGAGYPR